MVFGLHSPSVQRPSHLQTTAYRCPLSGYGLKTHGVMHSMHRTGLPLSGKPTEPPRLWSLGSTLLRLNGHLHSQCQFCLPDSRLPSTVPVLLTRQSASIHSASSAYQTVGFHSPLLGGHHRITPWPTEDRSRPSRRGKAGERPLRRRPVAFTGTRLRKPTVLKTLA